MGTISPTAYNVGYAERHATDQQPCGYFVQAFIDKCGKVSTQPSTYPVITAAVRESERQIWTTTTREEKLRIIQLAIDAATAQLRKERDEANATRAKSDELCGTALRQLESEQSTGAILRDRYNVLLTRAESAEAENERLTKERDEAVGVVVELKKFGATLQEWFPELNYAERYPIERMRFIARQYGQARTERDTALRELAEAKADTMRMDWLEAHEFAASKDDKEAFITSGMPIYALTFRAALDSALSREEK